MSCKFRHQVQGLPCEAAYLIRKVRAIACCFRLLSLWWILQPRKPCEAYAACLLPGLVL